MPRATRYLQDGFIYHLTHRCLDREYFLRFVKERDAYREWLRVGAKRHKVAVLGYTITCNHVHVLVECADREAVAAMMQLAAGSVAQMRNRRKERDGSMWEHPYHCTKVQDGRHLLNCLRYIDLNMVRAGRVAHPQEWRWCGYDEVVGKRKRYRILDQDRLLSLTGFSDLADLGALHEQRIAEKLAPEHQKREPFWTESIAVGDESFIEQAAECTDYRRSMVTGELEVDSGDRVWIIKERPLSYTSNFD